MTTPRDRGDAPRRDPETAGRPLADILREAGLESPRGRRRRGDEEADTGVRQRGAGGDRGADTGVRRRAADARDTGRVGERTPSGRRSGDRTGDPAPPSPQPDRRRARDAGPSTAAIPGLRPSRKPGVPGTATTPAAASGATASGAGRTPAAARDAGSSTGPIPVVRSGDDAPMLEDEALGPREGALAWLRFGGELVVALAAGVGIYFLFTVLWELLPYLAVVLAPLAVAGLVAAVAAWRQRQDKEHPGARLIGVLVFAGTLLTIAPAAALLTAG